MSAPARLLLAAVAAGLAWGCSEPASTPSTDEAAGAAAAAAPAAERRMAPDWKLKTLDGGEVSLSDLRGKTVVIDFWATWCPPCEFQVPELNAFWKKHASDGDVAVYGISIDVDGAKVVGPWVDQKGVKYGILLGSEDLARRYGAMGFPTLYVIGPDGMIDSTHVGLIEVAELESALARQRAGS